MLPRASPLQSGYVLLVDLGEHMNEEVSPGWTAFRYAKECLVSFIERKIFSESKDEVALFVFGSTETDNDLNRDDPDQYRTIALKYRLGAVNWALGEIADSLEPSLASVGNFVEAIVVASDYLHYAIAGRKMPFTQSCIFVISNLGGGTDFEDDTIKKIADSLKRQDIDLRFIGFDTDKGPERPQPSHRHGDRGNFPGSDNTQRGKPKSAERLNAEGIARYLVECTNGDSYSFEEAHNTLKILESKKTNSMPWRTPLEIAPGLTIGTESYVKVRKAKLNSWKLTEISTTISSGNQAGPSNASTSHAGTSNAGTSSGEPVVKKLKEFHLADGNDDDNAVERQELMRNYRYGVDLVHVADHMEADMKLQNNVKSFKVKSIVPADDVSAHLYLGEGANVVVADSRGGHSTAARFSAFVRALKEKNCVAIVRKVYSKAANPRIGVLVPELGSEKERDALYYVELPYADDLSMYNFSALPTTSAMAEVPERPDELTRTHHKMLAHRPSSDQLRTIDNLIDSTMLPTDDDDEPFKPESTRDPYVQRFYRSVRTRILHPDLNTPIEMSNEGVLELPENLQTQRRRDAIARISEEFDLLDRKNVEDQEPAMGPLGGDVAQDDVDVSAILGRPLASEAMSGQQDNVLRNISQENPLDDFLALVNSSTMPFEEVCEKLISVIYTILGTELGSGHFEKCLKSLLALRRQCVSHKKPDIFNKAVRDFFKRLSCIDFFVRLIQANAGLIIFDECQHDGAVTPQAATGFVESVRAKGGRFDSTASRVDLDQINGDDTYCNCKQEEEEDGHDGDDAHDLLANL